MLTPEENARLTQVGPGTPMGDLMRQYWLPVLGSSELEAGSRVKRVKILGEDLVAFRTQGGAVGLVGEFCPHRWASLYFGRIEPTGLRCVYHGWKFGFDGQCLDMPNEPPESDFKDKVCHAAYPCAERGGVVWAYMGPSSTPPGLPDLEWTWVPDEQRFVSKFFQHCGFMQALEGGIDPSHISFLHGVVDNHDDALIEDFDRAAAGFGESLRLRRAPSLEVADTEYGVLIGARREVQADMAYWRITQFHLPTMTMPPTDATADPILHSHIWVPVDDTNVVNWCISWHPNRALTSEEIEAMVAGKSIHALDYAPATNEPYGDIRPRANRHNDYLIDWETHRTRKFFGVPGVGMQDNAITESQPALYRIRERLGRSDMAIIRVRKRLLDAAADLQERGTPPPGLDPATYAIRPVSLHLPPEVPWTEGAKERLTARQG